MTAPKSAVLALAEGWEEDVADLRAGQPDRVDRIRALEIENCASELREAHAKDAALLEAALKVVDLLRRKPLAVALETIRIALEADS